MTTEQNKQAVRRYVQAFNEGNIDALRDLFAPDAAIQGVLGRGNLEFAFTVWRELHEAMDCTLAIESLCAEGDLVAARYTETGRFLKPFRGYPGMQPSGRSYSVVAMEWFTFDPQGRITSRFGARDSAAITRQISPGG